MQTVKDQSVDRAAVGDSFRLSVLEVPCGVSKARHDSLDKIILELSSSTQAKRNSRRQAGRSGAEEEGRKPSIHPETQSVQHRQH
ncbi:hypothetical protein Q7C36_015633 [Tachysurus vachellii]|uniref:Uncharacterized protein n=1 Tax=Tachysurus vachellii TaxID=175792 RepID=A0AA88SA10_TACVA|nr:hypothetical protein Q7C36_015633 [Tachysurus vachellii]